MGASSVDPDSQVDLLDWIRFVPFALAAATTFLGGEVLFRLTYPLGWRWFDRANSRFHTALAGCLRLVGVRLVIEDTLREPPGRPLIFAANHQSIFDIPLLAAALARYRPRFVAKRSLGRGIPTISFGLRRGQSALIDRANPRQSTRAILKLGRFMVERGCGVILFPEGRRARDGGLQPFQPAGVAALLKTAPGALVVPVAIDGSWRLARRGLGPIRRGTTVRLAVGAPLDPRRFRTPEALTAEARGVIAGALGRWREGGAAHAAAAHTAGR